MVEQNIESVLDQNHEKLLKLHPGVLNTAVGKKIVDGRETDEPAIIIYVEKKLPVTMLKSSEAIPKVINGIKTDVVELSHPAWKAGRTSVSDLPPSQQKLLAHGVTHLPVKLSDPKVPKTPKVMGVDADWRPASNKTQDQKSCGACAAFGNCKVWEIRHFQVFGEKIKLSEQYLFTCSGGTCSGGNTVDAVLNQALNGVALEADLPYAQGGGKDFACGAGLPDDWCLRAKKLKSWRSVATLSEMFSLIVTQPLNTTMAVHQSFFNYVSGVYHSLAVGDPIAGYHDIACMGSIAADLAWIIGNSWDGWGEDGYCRIAYGDSQIDDTMYQLEPSNEPVPNPSPNPPPGPTPSPCPIGNRLAGIGNIPLQVLHRTGRFYYMVPNRKA